MVETKRRRVIAKVGSVSRVEQSHRKECNINSIMAKYARTGLVPTRGEPGHYGDFTGVTDYQDSLERVRSADKSFMELPATVRARFKNDPASLLAFLDNVENFDEAVELGIIPTPEPVQPEPTPGDDPVVPE